MCINCRCFSSISIHSDISDNQIRSVHETPFKGLGQLHDLLLSYNQIETLPKDAFAGAPRLQLM